MNPPKRSRANEFLRKWMEQYDETSPPDAATVAGWKKEFHRLLDDHTKSATTHQQKLRLKALAVGGSHAFDRMLGTGSQTNLETFNDLVGLATGERSRTGLDPVRPRLSQRSAQQDWDIAVVVVAISRGYDSERGFEARLQRLTGMTTRKIRKLIDNMDQQRGRYDTIKVNIRDIETRLAEGETWMFDDLRK